MLQSVGQFFKAGYYMLGFITEHHVLISQIFGFAAMGTCISMYQFKKHRTVLLLMVLCSSLWGCCYYFLDMENILWTPILLNLVNVVRNFTLSFREKKWCRSLIIPAIFIVASLSISAFTWAGPATLLPMAASVSATIACWMTDKIKLRWFTYPVCIGWFFYNMIQHNPSAMCNEAFTFVSVTIALIRFYRQDRQKKTNKTQEKTDELSE